MSFITTSAEHAAIAHNRRQAAIAAARDADRAYAVGTLDAALDAHARVKARLAAKRLAPVRNALMMARLASPLAN